MNTLIVQFRKVTAHRFPSILLFSFLAVCPSVARAVDCGATGDIPFTITLLHPVPEGTELSNDNFIAKGPWFRNSGAEEIRDLPVGQPCIFYAAKDTILSPFGTWRIDILKLPSAELITSAVFGIEHKTRVDITVDPVLGSSRHFNITISIGGRPVAALDATAEQSQGSSPKEVSADAWLGDSKDSASGIPESDKFSFFGRAGDTVTIRLEADTQSGNNGGQATLRFEGPPARQVTGTLPKTITVQLASDGRYQIAVEQPTGGGELDYRGGYILKVKSTQGAIKTLVPALSVEK